MGENSFWSASRLNIFLSDLCLNLNDIDTAKYADDNTLCKACNNV